MYEHPNGLCVVGLASGHPLLSKHRAERILSAAGRPGCVPEQGGAGSGGEAGANAKRRRRGSGAGGGEQEGGAGAPGAASEGGASEREEAGDRKSVV